VLLYIKYTCWIEAGPYKAQGCASDFEWAASWPFILFLGDPHGIFHSLLHAAFPRRLSVILAEIHKYFWLCLFIFLMGVFINLAFFSF